MENDHNNHNGHNDHFRHNPSMADIGLTTRASNWLWAVFGIMLFSDLLFVIWASKRPQGQRVFHQISIVILSVSALTYFAMASNLGHSAVLVEFIRRPWNIRPTRAIWYARYIQWAINMPLLLLMTVLASGLPLGDIFTVSAMGVLFVISRMLGAFVTSSYKWGFFAFSTAALLYIWGVLLVSGQKSTGALHARAREPYMIIAALLSVVWMVYPIAWGLCEGGNVVSMTGEMVFYGILDLLAMPVFCFTQTLMLQRVPYEHYGFLSGKASSGYRATLDAAGTVTGDQRTAANGTYGTGRRVDNDARPA